MRCPFSLCRTFVSPPSNVFGLLHARTLCGFHPRHAVQTAGGLSDIAPLRKSGPEESVPLDFTNADVFEKFDEVE